MESNPSRESSFGLQGNLTNHSGKEDLHPTKHYQVYERCLKNLSKNVNIMISTKL